MQKRAKSAMRDKRAGKRNQLLGMVKSQPCRSETNRTTLNNKAASELLLADRFSGAIPTQSCIELQSIAYNILGL